MRKLTIILLFATISIKSQVPFMLNSYNPTYLGIGYNGGATNVLYTSTNGSNWYYYDTITPFQIVSNSTYYLYLGSYNYKSYTGLDRRSISTPFTTTRDAVWNGSYWVAVGVGATYTTAKSSDGVSWTGYGDLLSDVYSICYGNSKFVAGGYPTSGYCITYSSDGESWYVASSELVTCNGIKYNGSYYVAVGSASTNQVMKSSDAISWTGYGMIFGDHIGTYGECVCWNGSIWVVGGITTNSADNSISYSSNGEDWTGIGRLIFTDVYDIIWDGSKFIAFGSGTYNVATSTNGSSWTGQNVFSNNGWRVLYKNE